MWCGPRGIPLYGPSGASVHLRGIARAFADRGHTVRVFTPNADDDRGRWDADPAIPASHLEPGAWSPGLRTVGARLDGHRSAAALARWRPDLVWERHDPMTLAVGRWCRALGIPRWVELDAPLSLERRWPDPPRPWEHAREVHNLRSADRVFAVSRWLVRWGTSIGCARVHHLPNGITAGPPGDRGKVRRRLGLDGPVVGFVGSMHRWHGADRLPALLDALGPDWTGVAVGDGTHPPARHRRLIAVGHVSHRAVADHVAALDVGVAPYATGAPPWFCPLKVSAYRAEGVPAVTTATEDAAALVGETGAVVDDDAPAAWADAVRRVADQPRIAYVRTWHDVVDEALAVSG
ncbi:MAG: glycosyltransferase family 4 protein [Myxococcota bacterium]